MQGAAGDMSPNPDPGPWEPKSFGQTVADRVIALARSIEDRGSGASVGQGHGRYVPLQDAGQPQEPDRRGPFARSFFPEITHAYAKLYGDSLAAELNTVLLNGEIALVGGSGEFFCNHANRLKARSYVKHTLFFGYCNGHGMYFPTIEAASEGGYGADPGVSLAEVGAGERMMDRALINIYRLQGKFGRDPR